MNARHTGGKWDTGCVMTRVEMWPKGWNAPLCIADCHTEHAPRTEDERCANARLIASAPEMLKTLEWMRLAINTVVSDMHAYENDKGVKLPSFWRGELVKSHNKAIAQIKKATGE